MATRPNKDGSNTVIPYQNYKVVRLSKMYRGLGRPVPRRTCTFGCIGLVSTIANSTADTLEPYSVSRVSEYKLLDLPSSKDLCIGIFTTIL